MIQACELEGGDVVEHSLGSKEAGLHLQPFLLFLCTHSRLCVMKKMLSGTLPFLQHYIDIFEKRLEIFFVLNLHLEYAEYDIVRDRILVFYLF